MPTHAPPTDLPIHAFADTQAFETFLSNVPAPSNNGIYLKFAKKASGIATIKGSDAVETALCFGWIDGQAKPLDDQYWLVRFTPRRPKSMWSQKNVKTVATLIEQGRMRPGGLAAVDAAKADGRWERAYAGVAGMTVPDDLAAALQANKAAKTRFDALGKQDRYVLLQRLQTGVPKTREKRMQAMIKTLTDAHEGSASQSVSEARKAPALKKPVRNKRKADSESENESETRKEPLPRQPSLRAGLRNRSSR